LVQRFDFFNGFTSPERWRTILTIMPRVTLKSIAAKCGVSVSTVSLVLSGKGKISRELTEKVQKTTAEMGYVPNPQLAALASKRFRSDYAEALNRVALLEFPLDLANPEFVSNLYRELLQKEGQRLGYDIHVMAASGKEENEALAKKLFQEGFQGLVSTGEPPETLFHPDTNQSRFPVVQCGRGRRSIDVNTVRSDIFRSLKKGFLILRNLGYTRIGFGIGFHDHPIEDDEARFAAISALQSFYLPKTERIPCYRGKIQDRKRYIEWVQGNRPEVVIGFNNLHRWMLEDAGYRLPEDLGFISLHLDAEEGHRKDPTTGLDQERKEIAAQSILLLDQLIRYKTLGFAEAPVEVVVESVWKEGTTLSNPRRKPSKKKTPASRRKPTSKT